MLDLAFGKFGDLPNDRIRAMRARHRFETIKDLQEKNKKTQFRDLQVNFLTETIKSKRNNTHSLKRKNASEFLTLIEMNWKHFTMRLTQCWAMLKLAELCRWIDLKSCLISLFLGGLIECQQFQLI